MNYRGIDNVNFRNPNMSRPKGRPPFKPNCDPMPSAGRARYIPPNIQQPQYPPSVGYQRNAQYSPEYAVQYTPQVSAPPGWNHQSIPITMAETYMPNQHAYQPQGYNTEATHMIAIPNGAFIPQVQNQNDFDPVANMCICPKCQFMNSLAHLQLKALTEENKRLHEQLKAVEQQLSNANYEDGASTQVSSLSVDAQPFQMGATQEQSKPQQGTIAVTSNNGDPPRDWGRYDPSGTPVVSAHAPSECTRTEDVETEASEAVEPPSVSANCSWDRQQSEIVATASGLFEVERTRPRDQRQKPNKPRGVRTDSHDRSRRPAGIGTDSHDSNRDGDRSRRPAGVGTDSHDSNRDGDRSRRPAGVGTDSHDSNRDGDRSRRPAGVGTDSHDSNRDGDRSRRPAGVRTDSHDSNRDGDRSRRPAGVGTDSHDSNRDGDRSRRPAGVGTDSHDSNRDGDGSRRPAGVGTDSHDSNRDGDGSRRPTGVGTDSHDSNRDGDGSRRPSGVGTDSHDSNQDGDESHRNLSRHEFAGSNTGFQHRNSPPQDRKNRRTERSVAGSRDSSQSCPKTGQEHSDRREMDTRESGAKRGGRRLYEQAARGRGANEPNWRQDARPNRGGGQRRSTGGGHNLKAVLEKDGDLFTVPDDVSLAHCVAEDLRMGSGIAVHFRQKFKQVDELLDQRKRVGEVAVLETGSRFVFYLITKRRSSGKPEWGDFADAVHRLARLCVDKGVKSLAMPRIGCGLDRLEWRDVRRLLDEAFGETSVQVTAYNLQLTEEPEKPDKFKRSLYLVHQRKELADIDPETGLVFLCSEENASPDRTLLALDRKHKIGADVRGARRVLGEVVSVQKGREYLYGLVVRKQDGDRISYTALGKCLRKMRNANTKDQYGYFGMEAFRDEGDSLVMEKVVTLIRNIFGGVSYKLEWYICWPKELESDHLWEDASSK